MESTICFFNSTKAWGGGEKWHFDVAIRLAKKSYKVIVITHKASELFKRLIDTDLTVYTVDVSNFSFLNPFKTAKITNILRKENVQTIIMNLSADVKIAGIAAKNAGVKNIIYRRGLASPIKNRFLNRYLFKNIITHVLCNSEETKRTIYANNKNFIAPSKTSVIYNGIDLQEYDTRPIEQIYNRRNDEIIIGNAGRLVEQKGQKHLIEIAKILKTNNLNFKILIAGSGKLEQELKELAKKYDVVEQVCFLGFVKNIKSFMKAIDIFVLTSYWEGFGYVLVEAMACSKPIVAFDLTSNPEIVANNESGFLVSGKDSEAMAQKIIQLINNEELRTEMGAKGRKITEKRFEINKTIQCVEDLLKK